MQGDLGEMHAASAEVELEAGARARLNVDAVRGRVATGAVLQLMGDPSVDVETDAAGVVVNE